MPKIAVIINHDAGTNHSIDVADLAERLRAGGYETSITVSQNGADVVTAAKAARADGADIVVAGGGDGTINAVAAELIGTDIALGVLPLGTLNHFAKALGIPLKPHLAIQTLVAGYRTGVDVGEVNNTIFLNNSSIGIYPEIVRERELTQRRFGRSKWVAFFWASLKALDRYPFLNVQLDVNGTQLLRHTSFVFVGNNEYLIEGFELGERRTLSAGCLSLYVSQRTGRLGLFGFALRALFGRLQQARDFDMLLSTGIVIQTRSARVNVATDGEVTTMNTPLNYRIRPGALSVIVPEPTSA